MNKFVPKYLTKSLKNGCSIKTSYVSLINPFLLSNYSFENYKRFSYLKPNEKIYVKQSYMILTWFYYLNFVNKFDKKNKERISNVKFVILPKTYKKFTITKAPIAHKTRSKEQIMFTFFRFSMTFHIYSYNFSNYFFFYTDINQVLLSILLNKNSISIAETNLLFLQKKKIFLTFIDGNYLSYR